MFPDRTACTSPASAGRCTCPPHTALPPRSPPGRMCPHRRSRNRSRSSSSRPPSWSCRPGTAAAPPSPKHSSSRPDNPCTRCRPSRSGKSPDRTVCTRPARPFERLCPPRTPSARRCWWAQRSPRQSACTARRLR
eukprot:2690261-Prymnesium_polylepis.1